MHGYRILKKFHCTLTYWNFIANRFNLSHHNLLVIFKDQDHQTAHMLHKYTTHANMVWYKFTTFDEHSHLENSKLHHVLTSKPHWHIRFRNVVFMDLKNVNQCSHDFTMEMISLTIDGPTNYEVVYSAAPTLLLLQYLKFVSFSKSHSGHWKESR